MTLMKWIAAVLGVIGLLVLIAAIIYFTVPAHSLPSILGPCHSTTCTVTNVKRKRRGEAALAIGIVLWVVAVILLVVDRRSSTKVEAA